MMSCIDCEYFDLEKKTMHCDISLGKYKEDECIQRRLMFEMFWIRGIAENIANSLKGLVEIFADSSKIQKESSQMQKKATSLFGKLGKMMKHAEKEMDEMNEGEKWKGDELDTDKAKDEIDDLLGEKK